MVRPSRTEHIIARMEKISSAKCEAAYVLCYAVNGVPFLYNGCEHCDTSRHSIFGNPGQFFIDRSKDRTERTAFLRKLADLHRNEAAIHNGSMQWLENSAPESLCTWLRTAPDGEKIFCAVNLGNEPVRTRCAINGQTLLERGAKFGPGGTLTLEANGFLLIKHR